MRPLLVKVDGQNNVVLDIPSSYFAEYGLNPEEFAPFARSGSDAGHFRLKVGAATARQLGTMTTLGENARAWPRELPETVAATLVQALPHARERIAVLHSAGR